MLYVQIIKKWENDPNNIDSECKNQKELIHFSFNTDPINDTLILLSLKKEQTNQNGEGPNLSNTLSLESLLIVTA